MKIESSRYQIPKEDSDKGFKILSELAAELIEKFETLYTRDFKSSVSKKDLTKDQKSIVEDWLGYAEDRSSAKFFQSEFGFQVEYDRKLPSFKRQDLRITILERIRKSIKKFCAVMYQTMNYFDLEAADENLASYIETLLKYDADKLFTPYIYPRWYGWTNGPAEKFASSPIRAVAFVDGFICQGKTKHLEEIGALSFEMSEFFRIPLKTGKLLPDKYYCLYSLWGFFLAFFNCKKDEAYIDRCLILQSVFHHSESSAFVITKKFLDNFLNLYGVERSKFKFFLYDDTGIRAKPISNFNFLPHRQLELEIYKNKNFAEFFTSHIFRKLFLFFFLYKTQLFEIKELLERVPKLRQNYRILKLGRGFSIYAKDVSEIILPKVCLEEMILVGGNKDKSFKDEFKLGIDYFFDFENTCTVEQTDLRIFIHDDFKAKLIVDDSYNETTYFKSNPNSQNVIIRLNIAPIMRDNGLALPIFDRKNDTQNANIVGIKVNRSLDDGVDLIIDGFPHTLQPCSSIRLAELGIKFNPGQARYSQYAIRSRFFHQLGLDVEDDNLVITNFSDEPCELKKQAVISFIPRFKAFLKEFSNNEELAIYYAELLFGKDNKDKYTLRVSTTDTNKECKRKRPKGNKI